mmetsp:Transcript_3487/g.7611  ORF Transcript_3487/g.7611 Transcript_3487/m.7611 type:complete len:102 (+) Transcript_3487:313-618(+)
MCCSAAPRPLHPTYSPQCGRSSIRAAAACACTATPAVAIGYTATTAVAGHASDAAAMRNFTLQEYWCSCSSRCHQPLLQNHTKLRLAPASASSCGEDVATN